MLSLEKPIVHPHLPVTGFDFVAIAASAGGPGAVAHLLKALPDNFPAAVLIVQHRSIEGYLMEMLERCTHQPIQNAKDGEQVRPGTIYLAPAGHHTWVNEDHTFTVAQAPKIRFMQPSADLLFNSVALTYQTRAIGIILSGMLDDGAAGIYTIKRMGGTVIAQQPATASSADMPCAAIATGYVDFVLPVDKIAAALVTLVMTPGAASFFHVPPMKSPSLLLQ